MLVDLIAAVIAEHRTDGYYIRDGDADMWHWRCRLTGQLFDCPYNTRARTAAADGHPWPPPGRYRCTLDHGWLRIGEAVSA